MAEGQPITLKGKKEIEKELNHLITVERESLKKIIAEARAMGDLSENAEYQFAKEKQSLLEGKILQLQGIVATANVIDVSGIKNDKIVFGATVTLIDVEKDKQLKYQIVGKVEANLEKGSISYDSPLGKALIGKEEGDTITVKAPKGEIEYEIKGFKYV